jgi:hypothetical protein
MADDSSTKYNTVLEIIEKRLIPDQEAKKARGEVFTPLPLVRQMLYGVKKSSVGKGPTPVVWGFDEKTGEFSDDDEKDRLGGIPLERFRNADTTWLDPANGIGNFPVVAFYMIDYQLGKHGNDPSLKGDKNVTTRRTHIVENMLYMIELNKGNVNTSRKIFKLIAPDATSNSCCANTLTMTDATLQSTFGIKQFDVVMGNPPFNENLQDNPQGHAQDTGLWEEFVKKSMNEFVKKETGILAFLHPSRWRQPGHILHDIMFSKQFIYLSIHNKKDGKKEFKAITRFDYYILQNKKTGASFPVRFEDNNVSTLHITPKSPFISNFGYDIWEKIVDSDIDTLQVEGGGSTIKYTAADHATDDTCSKSKPYLNVNTTSKTPNVPKGARYQKTRKNSDSTSIYVDMVCSSNPHKLVDKKKVLFSKNEVIYPFYDNGKYGLTSNAFCILVDNKEDGTELVTYLNSKLIKYLIASVKFGNFSTAKNIFDYIPNPLTIKGKYSDDKLYKAVGLTDEQIRRIQNEKIEEPQEGGKRFAKTRKNKK